MMQSRKREPVTVLLLSFITCGIYGLYVIYQISREVSDFRGESSIDPGLEVLLCIFTGGLYTIYWYYKYAKLVFEMETRVGVSTPSDLSVIAAVLCVFKVGIISLMLLQSELNRVWDTVEPHTLNP